MARGIDRRLKTVAAYIQALHDQPELRRDLEKLVGQFSEDTLEEGWRRATARGDLRELLSCSLQQAIELGRSLTPILTEEDVRYLFALKDLTAKWGFGSSVVAVNNMIHVLWSFRQGQNDILVTLARRWGIDIIDLPPIRLQLWGKPSWRDVCATLNREVEKIIGPRRAELVPRYPGPEPRYTERDARFYAMRRAGLKIEEIIKEWNRRYPEDERLHSLYDYDRVESAITRFRKRLREATE